MSFTSATLLGSLPNPYFNKHPHQLLALLGIAQRNIKTKRIPDMGMTQRRKAAPKEIITLRDKLKKARLEASLTQRQVSTITGIPRLRLQEFERDERVPSPGDWKWLADTVGM